MHVAIRADGGPEIGYGHLVRTGALATELLERGHRVTYATTTPEYVGDVCPFGAETTELSSRAEAAPFVEWIDNSDVDVVVVDSYLADADYQRAVRDRRPLVLVSDDTRHAVCADAVVNGNLYAPELEYGVRGDEPTWCLGPDYVLLREEITQLAERTPTWRDSPELAIITMGGSDVANATPDAVRAFDGTALRVDVVVGPGFSNEAEIQDVADGVTADTRVVRDPPNLPELMFEADFAVGACGSTTYELLALGTPLVCSPVVENQERIASILRSHDLARVVPALSDISAIRTEIEVLSTNQKIRRRYLENGCDVIDGRGSRRVSETIVNVGE